MYYASCTHSIQFRLVLYGSQEQGLELGTLPSPPPFLSPHLEHRLGLLPDLVVLVRGGPADSRLDKVVLVQITKSLAGGEGGIEDM